MALPNIIQQINSKLPLSGGNISGDLVFCNTTNTINHQICVNNNSSYLEFYGGTDNNSSILQLHGNEYTANEHHKASVRVLTGITNEYSRKELLLKPDGTFTWCGNNVITSAGGNFNGAIYFKNGGYISRYYSTEMSSGASELAISSLSNVNDPYTGASIYLHDINDTRGTSQGGFFIYARNTKEKECGLCGYTDGTLTWNDKNVVCVTTWNSGTSWYRKYSNGWIEQGGTTYVSGNPYNLTFHLGFANTDYTFIGFYRDIDDNASITNCAYRTKYTSYIRLVQGYNGTSYPDTIMWYACGY